MPEHPTVTRFRPGESGLSCDGVPLAAIAARAGTPVYVYSADGDPRRVPAASTPRFAACRTRSTTR